MVHQPHKKSRDANGSYLIELLMALAISGFLAVALAASLSEQLRTSTGADNQVAAAEMAHVVIERFRQTSKSLPPFGKYQIPVTNSDGVTGSLWFQARPLRIDRANLDYPGVPEPSENSPTPVVFATLAPGPTATTSLLTVDVSWMESAANKNAVYSTLLSKVPSVPTPTAGIHL